MDTPCVAACVVVGDDVRDLHACLASLRSLDPLVTRAVVVGVGASDRLLDFARQGGATVETLPAGTDLAVARNRAAELGDASWVLVLDPHERVSGDPARLARLLTTELGAVVQPDALAVEVRRGGHSEAAHARELRLYRPETAAFSGRLDERLGVRDSARELLVLTPLADIVAIATPQAPGDPAFDRDRLRRREARAGLVVARLDAEEERGDDLVSALVERARARRELGDSNGALADLNRARNLPAQDRYRWQAREELALLLIEHRHLQGARTCIRELREQGADGGCSDWLEAQVHAAQGQARDALAILERLGRVTRADGSLIGTPEVLTEKMILAARIHEEQRALDCCVQLVTVHGLARRYGRLLLKLWGGRSPQGLADRLREAASGGTGDIADALRSLHEPGPQVADRLLAADLREPVPAG